MNLFTFRYKSKAEGNTLNNIAGQADRGKPFYHFDLDDLRRVVNMVAGQEETFVTYIVVMQLLSPQGSATVSLGAVLCCGNTWFGTGSATELRHTATIPVGNF